MVESGPIAKARAARQICTFSIFGDWDRPLSPRAGDSFRPRAFELVLALVVDEARELADSAEGDVAFSAASPTLSAGE
jgi:hypothetical protein